MSGPEPIRVLLVDDHAVVRSGLATFLMAFDDLELVGQASGGEEAVQLSEVLLPDVVLMDLVMPGMDGATATRLIRSAHPDVQVVVLTSFPENALIQKALHAGAIGYLLKNASVDQLVEAIRAARAGQQTLAPEAAQALVQTEKLEQLAHAIIETPPDPTTLAELLREHVPAIFPHSEVEVRIFPDQTLLRFPASAQPVAEAVWQWAETIHEAHVFLPGLPSAPPWADNHLTEGVLLVAPILGVDTAQPIGGLTIAQHGSVEASYLPSVAQALAAQIASTLHRAHTYAQEMAQERVARELALAREVQAGLLPHALPEMEGWQFAAILEPAQETSGDFYDFIPLPGGRLGIVIADVAGKGLGAALYMALCRTLIRTFAPEYDSRPERVLEATNRRILTDAQAELFASVFYGVLDPVSATLTYCNAGHNPPVLFRAGQREIDQVLVRTGVVLGAFEDITTWGQASVQLEPGDLLLLYTDGVTEAQNKRKEFFGEERMLAAVRAALGRPPSEAQEHLLALLAGFVGDVPQFDDITLVMLVRDST